MNKVEIKTDRAEIVAKTAAIKEWCTEQFGEPANYWEDSAVLWSHMTDFGNTRFYFVSAEQVAWFKLRWV